MGTPVKLISVYPAAPTAWLQKAQFRLEVQHSITVFQYELISWKEVYIAGEEELPGMWSWHRLCDRSIMTRVWLVDALDALLQKALRDRVVQRTYSHQEFYV